MKWGLCDASAMEGLGEDFMVHCEDSAVLRRKILSIDRSLGILHWTERCCVPFLSSSGMPFKSLLGILRGQLRPVAWWCRAESTLSTLSRSQRVEQKAALRVVDWGLDFFRSV